MSHSRQSRQCPPWISTAAEPASPCRQQNASDVLLAGRLAPCLVAAILAARSSPLLALASAPHDATAPCPAASGGRPAWAPSAPYTSLARPACPRPVASSYRLVARAPRLSRRLSTSAPAAAPCPRSAESPLSPVVQPGSEAMLWFNLDNRPRAQTGHMCSLNIHINIPSHPGPCSPIRTIPTPLSHLRRSALCRTLAPGEALAVQDPEWHMARLHCVQGPAQRATALAANASS